jgi:hypothetical protein
MHSCKSKYQNAPYVSWSPRQTVLKYFIFGVHGNIMSHHLEEISSSLVLMQGIILTLQHLPDNLLEVRGLFPEQYPGTANQMARLQFLCPSAFLYTLHHTVLCLAHPQLHMPSVAWDIERPRHFLSRDQTLFAHLCKFTKIVAAVIDDKSSRRSVEAWHARRQDRLFLRPG